MPTIEKAEASVSRRRLFAWVGWGHFVAFWGNSILASARFFFPGFCTSRRSGMLALAANVSCLVLPMRHRSDDLNMCSTWVCPRNDVMANGGVILAAGGIAITGTVWPDILIGLLIAGLFLSSAWGVIRASLTELRTGMTMTT